MAKIHFPESVLCVAQTGRELRAATNVPDEFRDFLHTKKFAAYAELKGIDPTDTQSSLIKLAIAQAKLQVYEEIMLFIAAKEISDFDTE